MDVAQAWYPYLAVGIEVTRRRVGRCGGRVKKPWQWCNQSTMLIILFRNLFWINLRLLKPYAVIKGTRWLKYYESLVLTKDSSLNWGSRVGKKFDWANLFLILWTQPHARFTSSHHNAKMSLHTTILPVLVFILIYSPFLLLGDHLPLEPPWVVSGLGYSVPSPPCCLDLRNRHIGESWV